MENNNHHDMKKPAIWIRPINLTEFISELVLMLAGNALITIETNNDFISNSAFLCQPPDYVMPEAKSMRMTCMKLEANNAHTVLQAIMQNANWIELIDFMQIYKNGERVFLAGDSFHKECISFRSKQRFELVDIFAEKQMIAYQKPFDD